MGKRYIHYKSMCPFYHSEDDQKIYCEGSTRDNSIHLAFGSKTKKLEYRDQFCCQNYKECTVAKGLFTKYYK